VKASVTDASLPKGWVSEKTNQQKQYGKCQVFLVLIIDVEVGKGKFQMPRQWVFESLVTFPNAEAMGR
jgi:hypothetical protein